MAINIKEKVENVQISFGRCATSPDFMKDFYDDFLASSPLVQETFKNTDMQVQRDLLKNGLTYLIMYANGSVMAKNKMEKLGKSHDKNHMNINPQLYKYWVNSLLRTIKIHDYKMTRELFDEWKEVILIGVEKMKSMHGAHEHVSI